MWIAIEVSADLFQSILAIYFMNKTCNLRDHLFRFDCLFTILTGMTIYFTSAFELYYLDILNDLFPLLYAICFTQNRKISCVFWAFVSAIIVAVEAAISSTLIIHLTGQPWEMLLKQNNARISFIISGNVLLMILYVTVGNLASKNRSLSMAAMICFIASIVVQFAAAECFFFINTITTEDILPVLGSIGMLISLIFTVVLYEIMMRQSEKQKELELSYQTALLISSHQDELKSIYASMLSVQHDLRHRIKAAEEILSHQDASSYNEAISLLKGTDVLQRHITGCTSVDAVLASKSAVIDENHIRLRFYPIPLGQLPLPETKFAVLLSNILDNAIEGVMRLPEISESREIELIFSRNWDMFSIICKNDADISTIVRKNNQFISSKTHPNLHGYGTKSMQRTVEEAGGLIEYEIEDNKFVVNILLPMEETEC